MARVLITGGAGFVGSHVASELLHAGYDVRVLDNLTPQVHGDSGKRPAYLDSEVELVRGDVRDEAAVRRALKGIDAVYHFAARVGVGQSMYEVAEYTSVNNYGTAVLLECLSAQKVERLIVASSMSIYGEGLYTDCRGQMYPSCERRLEELKAGQWELRNASGDVLRPLPTPETKPPSLIS